MCLLLIGYWLTEAWKSKSLFWKVSRYAIDYIYFFSFYHKRYESFWWLQKYFCLNEIRNASSIECSLLIAIVNIINYLSLCMWDIKWYDISKNFHVKFVKIEFIVHQSIRNIINMNVITLNYHNLFLTLYSSHSLKSDNKYFTNVLWKITYWIEYSKYF